jgi:hypothetical protein
MSNYGSLVTGAVVRVWNIDSYLHFWLRYRIINKNMFDIGSGMLLLYGISRKLSIEKREV